MPALAAWFWERAGLVLLAPRSMGTSRVCHSIQTAPRMGRENSLKRVRKSGSERLRIGIQRGSVVRITRDWRRQTLEARSSDGYSSWWHLSLTPFSSSEPLRPHVSSALSVWGHCVSLWRGHGCRERLVLEVVQVSGMVGCLG